VTFPVRLLLFDIDGTLIEPRGAGRVALRSAMLEVYGQTGPIDDHDFRGKTDPWIVRDLLRSCGWADEEIDARLDEVWEPYLRHLDDALEAEATRPTPCRGVTALLDRLSADDRYELALLTGNVEEGATRKLRAAGISRFDVGAFGSDSEHRADLPPIAVARAAHRTGLSFRVEEAIVVGDTPEDVLCARANHARVLAVATGGFDADDLRSHEPDGVLENLSDSDSVMEALEDVIAGTQKTR
jgi:phosphoglycolate phosphatase-like HAD superfamily hydrolase